MQSIASRWRWWRGVDAAVVAVLAGLLMHAPALAGVTATLDLSQRHQTIDGFGTAVQSDSEAWYGWDINSDDPNAGNPARVQQYADLMFDRMGASILRFEVGPYAIAERVTSRTDLDYTQFRGGGQIVTTGNGVTAAQALAHNRQLMDMDALRVRPGVQMSIKGRQANPELKLIGTVWTPPFAFKKNELYYRASNDPNDPGYWQQGDRDADDQFDAGIDLTNYPTQYHPSSRVARIDQPNNNVTGGVLDPDKIDEYAHYLAAYVAEFEATTGAPMHGLSLQNEPDITPFYNSTYYVKEVYIPTAVAVRDALNAAGLQHVKLFGPELTAVGSDVENYGGGNQLGDGGLFNTLTWVDEIAELEAQLGYRVLDIVATHGADGRSNLVSGQIANDTQRRWDWYWNGRDLNGDGTIAGGQNFELQPGFTRYLDELPGIAEHGRPGWMTEYSGASHEWAPDADPAGLTFGALDQAIATYEALVYGNQSAYVLWQLAHDDYGSQTRIDEALVKDLDDPDAPKLAAFQHFSKLIRPGMQRFEVDITADTVPALASLEEATEPAFGVSINNRGDDVLAAGFVDDGRFTIVLINPTGDDETITLDVSALLDHPAEGVHLFRSSDTERFAAQPILMPDANGVITFILPGESIVTLSDLTSGLAAIPEPASLGLAALGLFLIAFRQHS
ncbi:MAG: PEP-CTERM sorting domain-containing protein [Planctomycetota bacterium]